jgi:hypothetical protein
MRTLYLLLVLFLLISPNSSALPHTTRGYTGHWQAAANKLFNEQLSSGVDSEFIKNQKCSCRLPLEQLRSSVADPGYRRPNWQVQLHPSSSDMTSSSLPKIETKWSDLFLSAQNKRINLAKQVSMSAEMCEFGMNQLYISTWENLLLMIVLKVSWTENNNN